MIVMGVGDDPRMDAVAPGGQKTFQIARIPLVASIQHDDAPVRCLEDIGHHLGGRLVRKLPDPYAVFGPDTAGKTAANEQRGCNREKPRD